MAKARRVLVGLAGAALVVACGGGGGGSGMQGGGPPGFYIVISGSAFSPPALAVPPGATVTVVNRDGMAHSVTSAEAAGAFTPGTVDGVGFDTGPFTGRRTFDVPADAVADTVVPYYCSVHKGAMATPNATIRIDPSAEPAPEP
jgi:plastocyanin